jgi:hypothetical protein
MWQQGQVFKLKAKRVDGQPLWAYRYRLEGRGSTRPQVGGFATRADALKALEKVLARLGPSGRAATMTLGELVDELCVPETGFAPQAAPDRERIAGSVESAHVERAALCDVCRGRSPRRCGPRSGGE